MKSIGVAPLRRLMDAGAQVVDELPETEFREAHLPGALSIPLNRLDARAAQGLDRSWPVIVYCWDSLWELIHGPCDQEAAVCQRSGHPAAAWEDAPQPDPSVMG